MHPIKSFDDILPHLKDEAGLHAKSSLGAYFYRNAFTGSSFEKFIDPFSHVITPTDLIAVSMLRIDVPATASRWLLQEGNLLIQRELSQIPLGIHIVDEQADLSKDSPAYRLWALIHSCHRVGEVTTSKLMAAKRPDLFPIFDQHVGNSLGITDNRYWVRWQTFMRSDRGAASISIVRDMAQELGIRGVSDLRLLDVIIWMQAHGYSFITQKAVVDTSMIAVTYANPT